MRKELVEVRADMVDNSFWIETTATHNATVQLHAALELSRQNPSVWKPVYVLCGEEGSGKSALATRVAKQAQRSVSCRLGDERLMRGQRSDPRPDGSEAAAFARAQTTALDFGYCRRICSPMAYRPADLFKMGISPGWEIEGQILSIVKDTPGNRDNDPLRRTSMILVDEADNLMNLSVTKQRIVIEKILDALRGELILVLIGSPRLVEAMRLIGTIQVIALPDMEFNAEFSTIVEMIFGFGDKASIAEMHRLTKGRIGPLMYRAALRGLKPPYNLKESQILRLPPPI
jgi:hypothetical protein